MALTEQERKLEKSAAKAYGSLLVGLVGLALLVDVQWEFRFLIALGVVSALFIIYLILPPYGWKRKRISKRASTVLAKVQIEHLTWLVVLGVLGIGLIQKGCIILTILGLISVFAGIAIFVCAFRQADKKKLKERHGN
jgi:hypothetical protein